MPICRFSAHPFILMLFLCPLAACSSKIMPPTMIDQGKIQIISHDSTQVATYILKNEKGVWLCKENITDAVKTSQEGATLKGLAPNESVNMGASSGAVSLGGMAPEVLITSELLYRACELCANLNADEQLTLKIYQMFLDAVDKTADAQKELGAAPIYGQKALPETDSTQPASASDSAPASTDD